MKKLQDTPMSESVVMVGGRQLSLAEFFTACARSLDTAGLTEPDMALNRARDALLAGGLPAVGVAHAQSCWVQVGLAVAPGRLDAVYAELLRTAEDLLAKADVENFFFMHKPPGLRLRFEATGAAQPDLERKLFARTDSWQADGLIERLTPAVYEPEAHLFGGPVSMAFVHRLFTADSLAWLGYHVLAADADARPGPSWAFSLRLLREFFAAMGVVGWEDRDVWDRVRRETGRSLPEAQLATDAFTAASSGIRSVWCSQDSELCPEAADLIELYGKAARAEARRWRGEYFATRQAYVGPREAAAYYVVYHWNRGGLPIWRQALIAESLARPAKAMR